MGLVSRVRVGTGMGIRMDTLELVSLCWKASQEIERLNTLVEESGVEDKELDQGLMYALRFCERGTRSHYIDEFPELSQARDTLNGLNASLQNSKISF